MQDIIAALIALLLVEPVEARLNETLKDAGAPEAIVAKLASCARAATPVVVERVTTDPWWGVSAVVRVWSGSAAPETILLDAAPACGPAVEAARPFLTSREA